MTFLARLWYLTRFFFSPLVLLLNILAALTFALISGLREQFQGKSDGIYVSNLWKLIKERPDDDYYEECICDYEAILPELAEILGAQYEPGDYDAAEAAFTRAVNEKMQKKIFTIFVDDSKLWFLTGDRGRLAVDFVYGDGYFLCLLQAKGDVLARAARLLHDEALCEGANLDALQTLPKSGQSGGEGAS